MFRVIELGGLHVAGLIIQAFYTVFSESFFIFATAKGFGLSYLLTDILDVSVSLLS